MTREIMTAEEKAEQMAEQAIPDILSNYHISRKYFSKGYLAGYNEAMRWRDPLKELPGLPKDGYCQVLEKNRNGIYFFHEIRNQGDIDDLSISAECGHGIVWRPIEEGG